MSNVYYCMRFMFLILVILLCNACNKKECLETTELNSMDTIFPNPYLPAYPGSWWEYNDTILVETYDNWQEFKTEAIVAGEKCNYLVKDIKIVPVIQSEIDEFVVGNKLF